MEEQQPTKDLLNPVARASHSSADRVLGVGLHALSLLHIGLVVCNADGEVLEANRIAMEILESRAGLQLSAERTLCATQECEPAIAEIVRRVAAGEHRGKFGSKDAALAVRRGANRRPLTVFVRPIPAARTPSAPARSAVLVMILDSALPVRAIDSHLRELYGLTSTEARLANLLMEGKALEECCVELGICRSTACTHLRRLFKKTGVHRQCELVGLLLKAIGLVFLGEARTSSATRRESESKSSRLDTSAQPAAL